MCVSHSGMSDFNIKKCGFKKAAILATEGTINSRSYQNEFEKYGMDYSVPDKVGQDKLMNIIYEQVKKGGIPSPDALYDVTSPMFASGCDCAILGCTELSLIGKSMADDDRFVDSLMVLANCAIKLMGHQTVGFPKTFD